MNLSSIFPYIKNEQSVTCWARWCRVVCVVRGSVLGTGGKTCTRYVSAAGYCSKSLNVVKYFPTIYCGKDINDEKLVLYIAVALSLTC